MAAVALLKTTVSKSNSNASSASGGSSAHHHHHHAGNRQQQQQLTPGGGAISLQQQQHNQLTRSLERILEDAHLSGELKLSGRKLRDFPKAAGKYNLNDTVIADLSRNRFSELPDDVAAFPFLETLFMCHNTLRSLPETVRGLHSLTYLDLRSNQLSVLPREICFLPLQVLLISNNRLVSLPEELGRMDRLTELDAASNQMSHLPARMSDLHALRSLSLRSNQLVYLPREVTYLSLQSLDISCNRIASLPVELRIMTTLVTLELDNNPLTSPPASVCVRGLVHVFKYLETVALKEERIKSGGSLDGHGTLRRSSAMAKPPSASSSAADSHKYNTLGGVRRSAPASSPGDSNQHQQLSAGAAVTDLIQSKWSPSHQAQSQPAADVGDSSRSTTPASMSPMAQRYTSADSPQHELDKKMAYNQQQQQHTPIASFSHGGDESSPSPDGGDGTPDSQRSDEKVKMTFNNMQSYREYKEALRQQRQQDSTAVYRTKGGGDAGNSNDGGGGGGNHVHFASPECTPTYKPPAAAVPHPMHHNNGQSPTVEQQLYAQPQLRHSAPHTNGAGHNYSPKHSLGNGSAATDDTAGKPPTKLSLTPSKSALSNSQTYQAGAAATADWSSANNGNPAAAAKGSSEKGPSYNHYVKPSSPCKTSGLLGYNNVPGTNGNNSAQKMSSSTSSGGVAMSATSKPQRSVSWNRDIPTEKLSFTMRREFDKQKEETELIGQLRQIIETRLKMTLPEDVASALTDGVVLCHLANQVRPRLVGTIHVPSPAVPKLTMAKCRRNVDNFLNACRNIGVDEEWLCVCADIVPAAAAAAASPNTTVPHHPDGQTASDAATPPNGEPTSATPSPTASSDQPERLTPAALVAVHRVVLGLHTWALATDGGQPRTPPHNHHITTTNTKTADEYQQRQPQHQHTHAHNPQADAIVEGHDNHQRRPNSLELASANNGNGTMRRRTVADAYTNALNNNNNGGECSTVAAAAPRSKKRSRAPKRTFGPNGQLQLIGIEEEECEYDSDAGKFTCATGGIVIDDSSASSSVVTTTDTISSDVSSVTDFVAAGERSSLEETGDDDLTEMGALVEASPTVSVPVLTADERRRSTLLCVIAFVATALWLYWFPVAE